MTIEDYDKQLDSLAKQQETLRSRADAVMKLRNAALTAEHCDYWGLTPDQYAAAKAWAKANGLPLSRSLTGAYRLANRKANG